MLGLFEATLPPTEPSSAVVSRPVPQVPGYEVLAELGRCGMGVVYKARQTRLNRVVALKMILAGGHADPEDLARFRTEAEAIARLQHSSIVQIHEVGEHEGLPFFSLEFCPGGNLERKRNGTPVPPREAAALALTAGFVGVSSFVVHGRREGVRADANAENANREAKVARDAERTARVREYNASMLLTQMAWEQA